MLCVIALLSPEADQSLTLLREAALPGVQFTSPLHAHITLATYLPEDTDAFIRSCAKMFGGTRSFTVRYEQVKVLSDIIIAAPSMSPELISLHRRIADQYSESLDQWTAGDLWYPHTTLYCNPESDLNAVCAEMRKHFVPFETRISEIEFSRVGEAGYTVLKKITLL